MTPHVPPLGLFVVLLFATVVAAAPPDAKPKPKFTLGKDTTYITEPLDKDGYVDYETALNERLRGTITPETNAVVLLMQAIGPKPEGKELHADWWKWLGVKPPPAEGTYFVRLDEYRKRNREDKRLTDEELEREIQQDLYARSRPWKSEEYPFHAEWLRFHSKAIGIAIEASKRPRYFNPLVSRGSKGTREQLLAATLVCVQEIRSLSTALVMRAMLNTGEGRNDEAWEDLLAIRRLAKLSSQGGTSIELLVGCAIDGIAAEAMVAQLEVVQHDQLRLRKYRNDLNGFAQGDGLPNNVVLGERVIWLDIAQSISQNGYWLMERILATSHLPKQYILDDVERIYGPFDWNATMRYGNRWFDRYERDLVRTDRTRYRAALSKLEEDNKLQRVETMESFDIFRTENFGKSFKTVMGEATGHVLVALLFPALPKVSQSVDRAEQKSVNLRLAFALAAHRADTGGYPMQLADLAPKYLAAIPDDLFTGQPLVYKPAKDGYLLYSVGANGKDDGGKTYGDEPYGCDDLVVSMPLPKLRKE